MDAATLQQVRSTPLFAGLTDEQLDCIEPGEIIELPAGTVLESEGNRAEFFYVNLEGQVRITRMYDRQEILMGVNKPGGYMGETMLLLDAPWLATARAVKPTRLFRLDEKNFWRMLTACQTVAREIFRSAATRMRNMEGYSHQREKLVSLGTMAAGLAHELNNPAAAARRAAAHLEETSNKVQSLFGQLAQPARRRFARGNQLFGILVTQLLGRKAAALGDFHGFREQLRGIDPRKASAQPKMPLGVGVERVPADPQRRAQPDRGQRVLQAPARAHVHVHVARGDGRQAGCPAQLA